MFSTACRAVDVIRRVPSYALPSPMPISWLHNRHCDLSHFFFPANTLNANRFCSLSWYDRQLIENSRGGGDEKEGPPKSGGAGDSGEKDGPVEDALADASPLSPPARLHCSDGGFGARARPVEASVLATLKVRADDQVNPSWFSSGIVHALSEEARAMYPWVASQRTCMQRFWVRA